MSELTVLIKTQIEIKSNPLSCDAMINDVYTIVCGVSNEFCIGKAVSLTKVPLPELTEYLAGCPKFEV